MDLVTIRTGVQRNLGISTDDSFYNSTRLNGFINEALSHISTMRDWPWLHTSATDGTDAADGTYPWPANCIRIRQVVIDTVPYEQVDESDIAIYDRIGHCGGLRYVWAATGVSSITVRPIPDVTDTANITFLYVRSDVALSADGDATLIPDRFAAAPVAYATALAHQSAGKTQEADRWFDQFDRQVKQMRDEAARSTTPRRVRIRPGGL